MYPHNMTFMAALRAGLIRSDKGWIRNRPYLDWVKTGTCPCGAPADDPSHVNTFKGMGTKSPDLFTWPSCRHCHELYENERNLWLARYDDEWMWVALTIAQAIEEGVITL